MQRNDVREKFVELMRMTNQIAIGLEVVVSVGIMKITISIISYFVECYFLLLTVNKFLFGLYRFFRLGSIKFKDWLDELFRTKFNVGCILFTSGILEE